jgi:hypothetical protein
MKARLTRWDDGNHPFKELEELDEKMNDYLSKEVWLKSGKILPSCPLGRDSILSYLFVECNP